MALNVKALLEAPIIELDSIDSTNNYAMRLIDADTAQPGLTITATEQTMGRGQRGRSWEGEKGQSLMMSIITHPQQPLTEQFAFNAAVTVAIADVLQGHYEHCHIQVKWPNDIIANDKKAGGILIENVLRGSNWLYSIIGLGLNINQKQFPDSLPYATSLKIASGKEGDISELIHAIRNRIFENTAIARSVKEMMTEYNAMLYRRGQLQKFGMNGESWMAQVTTVNNNGTLKVQTEDGKLHDYIHGQENWEWA